MQQTSTSKLDRRLLVLIGGVVLALGMGLSYLLYPSGTGDASKRLEDGLESPVPEQSGATMPLVTEGVPMHLEEGDPIGPEATTEEAARIQASAPRSLDHLEHGQILDLLRSDDPDSKRRAAAEIVKRSEPRLIAALLDEASNTAPLPLRADLVDAVAEVDAQHSADAMVRHVGIRRDSDLKKSVHAALIAAGSPEIIAALVNKAEENLDDEYMSREIGRVLSEIRNPEAMGELIAGLNAMNFTVFVGCAAALGAIGEPESIRALKEYAGRGGDYDAVIEEALARIRNEAVLPLMTEWVSDGRQPVYPVRQGILRAMGEMQSAYVESALHSILQYEHDAILRDMASSILQARLEGAQ